MTVLFLQRSPAGWGRLLAARVESQQPRTFAELDLLVATWRSELEDNTQQELPKERSSGSVSYSGPILVLTPPPRRSETPSARPSSSQSPMPSIGETVGTSIETVPRRRPVFTVVNL